MLSRESWKSYSKVMGFITLLVATNLGLGLTNTISEEWFGAGLIFILGLALIIAFTILARGETE